MNYAKSNRNTPQTSPIAGENQVLNAAGGYVYEVSKWTVLDRFLVLGTENGTYYANEGELTLQATDNTLACIQEDPNRVLSRLVEISTSGRAHKNEAVLYVLALCASLPGSVVRSAALEVLPLVARTATHLFYFVSQVKELRGWGRNLRKGISNWYNGKTVEQLGYQIVKYRSRYGYSHQDVLRLAHPVPASKAHDLLFAYATGKQVGKMTKEKLPDIVSGYLAASELTVTAPIVKKDKLRAVSIIEKYGLSWEMLPTQYLAFPEIWQSLLPKMGLTAMIRNLGRMTANGTLTSMSETTDLVCAAIVDVNRLTKERVHPMTILLAVATYREGRGFKGSLTWTPLARVLDALDKAFYLSFGNLPKTQKKVVYALDVSGSMSAEVSGVNMSCTDAAIALTLVQMATAEKGYSACVFATTIREVQLTPRLTLAEANRVVEKSGIGGGTNLSLPLMELNRKGDFVDALVMFTDNETWAGSSHVVQELDNYRRKVNPNFKMVVVSLAVNKISVLRQNDLLSLDAVGLDANTPTIISEFIG